MWEKFSYKEYHMFKAVGLSSVLLERLDVMQCYRKAVEDAFIKKLEGNAVDSLRRCFHALQIVDMNRKSQEFDNLIKL